MISSFPLRFRLLAFAILLPLLAHAETTASTPLGSGSSSDPYLIASLANLRWVSEHSDHWGSSYYFKQTANIDASETSTWNSGAGFATIGDSITAFSGNYSGGDWLITGLSINRPSERNVGMFGYVSSTGVVSSTRLVGASVSGNFYVGAVVGRSLGSVYSCFSVGGTVKGANQCVGGLVGYTIAGIIANSRTSGTVAGTLTEVGGLVGWNENARIEGSHSSAKVSGTNRVGGLVGYQGGSFRSTDSIVNSYASGDVTASGNYAGGLVGESYAAYVSRSYAVGSVSGVTGVGGLIGWIEDGAKANQVYAQGAVSGTDAVGGLVGWLNGTVSGSYCTGPVRATTTTKVGGHTGYSITASRQSPSVTTSYWSSALSGQSASRGDNDGTGTFTASDLSATQLRNASNFGLDFTTTWSLYENRTYPGLQAVSYNAPYVYRDTLTGSSIALARLLKNDTAIFSSSPNLFVKVDTIWRGGTVSADSFHFASGSLNDSITYRAGWVDGLDMDTLWSARTRAVLLGLSGSGTESDPYQVGTYPELEIVHFKPSSVFRQTADIDASASSSESGGFTPIGGPFSGTYHGGGHAIRGLVMDRKIRLGGLFDSLTGTVDSLGVVANLVFGNNQTGGIVGYYGILAGYSSGRILQSHVDGALLVRNSMKTDGSSYYGYVGGLVGQNIGRVDSCYSTAVVNFEDLDSARFSSVGGLIGYNLGGTVRRSYATGNVSTRQVAKVKYHNNYGFFWLGGLVGGTEADTVTDCYATGIVTLDIQSLNGMSDISGLIGYGTGYVAHCYAMGSVRGDASLSGLTYQSGGKSSNSYWDKTTSRIDSSHGVSSSYGLTSAQMRHSVNFSDWDSASVWTWGANGNTPAGFSFLDNAPFAYPDTLSSKTDTFHLDSLLVNDHDLETGSANLVVHVVSASQGILSSDSASYVVFPDSVISGDSIVLVYRVGEVRSAFGDTLWGNATISKITLAAPLRGAIYALYSGKKMATGSSPVIDSLVHGLPTVTALASTTDTAGVAWADSGETSWSAKGFRYQDTFANVSEHKVSRIVAHVRPTFHADTLNTLLTEGFGSSSVADIQTWVRVGYREDSLYLDYFSNGNRVRRASAACDSAVVFSGKWLPIDLALSRNSGNSSKADFNVYLGYSSADANSCHVELDNVFDIDASGFTVRAAEIPQPGIDTRAPTLLDAALSSTDAGEGGALVGDFGMLAASIMTRRTLLKSYLNPWTYTGSGSSDSAKYVVESQAPVVTQILYAAPGDNSKTDFSRTSTRSYTTTINTSYGGSLGYTGGYELDPGLETGYSGYSVLATANVSMTQSSSSTYATTITNTNGLAVTESDGDQVITNVLRVKSRLAERPRMRYLKMVNPIDSEKIFAIQSGIESDSSNVEVIQSVSQFLKSYASDTQVVANFRKLYAKDVSTGLIRDSLVTQGLLEAAGEFQVDGSAEKTVSTIVDTTSSITQSFDITTTAEIDAKIIVAARVAEVNVSFTFDRDSSTTEDKSSSFQTDLDFKDDDAWDQHDVLVYKDKRWGVPVYQLNKDSSYTSGPVEPNSNSVTTIGLSLGEGTDTIHVGDTVSATIKVANNSSKTVPSSLVDSVQFLIEPDANFSGIYNLVEIQPAQFELARGDSQLVAVRYVARSTSSIPAGFTVSDDYAVKTSGNYLESSELQSVRGVQAYATGISGFNPSRFHTLGSLDLSAARILPSAAQGISSAQLGLSSCQDAGTCQSVGILLPEAGTISVHIFDLLGTPVISWSQSVDSSALASLDATNDGRRVATLSWNLRAGNGVAVPAGVYLWKIEVETTNGQKLETVKKLGVK